MLGSLANEGFMEEIVAVGINAKGAVVFPKEDWIQVAVKYGVPDTVAYADKAMARNEEVLNRSYELGQKLVENR